MMWALEVELWLSLPAVLQGMRRKRMERTGKNALDVLNSTKLLSKLIQGCGCMSSNWRCPASSFDTGVSSETLPTFSVWCA